MTLKQLCCESLRVDETDIYFHVGKPLIDGYGIYISVKSYKSKSFLGSVYKVTTKRLMEYLCKNYQIK